MVPSSSAGRCTFVVERDAALRAAYSVLGVTKVEDHAFFVQRCATRHARSDPSQRSGCGNASDLALARDRLRRAVAPQRLANLLDVGTARVPPANIPHFSSIAPHAAVYPRHDRSSPSTSGIPMSDGLSIHRTRATRRAAALHAGQRGSYLPGFLKPRRAAQ